MAVQNTYNAEHAAGFAGGVVDSSLKNIVSKVVEGGSIAQGLAVVRGTGDDQVISPSTTGQGFIGVTVSTTAGQADGNNSFVYEVGDVANVLDNGLIYVTCENGCVPGDSVYFRFAAGAGGTTIGAFRTDSDSDTADLIPNATFESTACAGGIAVLKLK